MRKILNLKLDLCYSSCSLIKRTIYGEEKALKNDVYLARRRSDCPLFLATSRRLSLTLDSQGIFNSVATVNELQLTITGQSKLQGDKRSKILQIENMSSQYD